MAKKRINKTLVRAQAYCHDCEWTEENEDIAQKEGRKHALKTGHRVTVETGYIQIYNEEEGS